MWSAIMFGLALLMLIYGIFSYITIITNSFKYNKTINIIPVYIILIIAGILWGIFYYLTH